METSTPSSSSDPPPAITQSLLEALTGRGWCFKDVDKVKDLIAAQFSSRGKSCTVDSVESELVNLDLRSIGGRSLPEPSHLRHAAHLLGPKVLQISCVRDISKSNVAEISGNSSNKRLLKLKLTDGNSEVIAIEYSYIPSIPDNVVRGTKVRLENKAMVRNGIVCLDAKITKVLGGVVPTLYEEWQMDQKYSGFSRSSVRPSDEISTSCPPPFEKLQIGASSLQQKSRSSEYSMSLSLANSSGTTHGVGKSSTSSKMVDSQSGKLGDSRKPDVQPSESSENAQERAAVPDGSQKEVVESIPVQNQAAAQKLLQRMNQPNYDNQHIRGMRHRRKEKVEEPAVLTLDEWERRKAGVCTSTAHSLANVSQDEVLARQLQEQFDLEDTHVQKDPHMVDAENIRMSMFNFERENTGASSGMGYRGRGRGRGRGGGRGRGRRGGRGRG